MVLSLSGSPISFWLGGPAHHLSRCPLEGPGDQMSGSPVSSSLQPLPQLRALTMGTQGQLTDWQKAVRGPAKEMEHEGARIRTPRGLQDHSWLSLLQGTCVCTCVHACERRENHSLHRADSTSFQHSQPLRGHQSPPALPWEGRAKVNSSTFRAVGPRPREASHRLHDELDREPRPPGLGSGCLGC